MSERYHFPGAQDTPVIGEPLRIELSYELSRLEEGPWIVKNFRCMDDLSEPGDPANPNNWIEVEEEPDLG